MMAKSNMAGGGGRKRRAMSRWEGMIMLGSICLLGCSGMIRGVNGLYEEEAGTFDFVVATSGREGPASQQPMSWCASSGPTSLYTHPTSDGTVWVSAAAATTGSGWVAGRTVEDGSVAWRRHVSETAAAVWASTASGTVFTNNGLVLQGWNDTTGSLLTEQRLQTTTSTAPGLLGVDVVSGENGPNDTPIVQTLVAVLSSSDTDQTVEWFTKNQLISIAQATSSADALLHAAKVRPSAPAGVSSKMAAARILKLVAGPSGTDTIQALCAWVFSSETTTSGTNMAWITLRLTASSSPTTDAPATLTVEQAEPAVAKNQATSTAPFFTNSLAFIPMSDGEGVITLLMGISPDGGDLIPLPLLSSSSKGKWDKICLADIHPMFSHFASVSPVPGRSSAMIVSGYDRINQLYTMALFFHDGDRWKQQYEKKDEETEFDGLAYCPESSLMLTLQEEDVVDFNDFDEDNERVSKNDTLAVTAWHVGPNKQVTKLSFADNKDILVRGSDVRHMETVECTASQMTAIATTYSGSTIALRMTTSTTDKDVVSVKLLWQAEESLASITSAVFLDETPPALVGASKKNATMLDDEETFLQTLTFQARLEAQIQSFMDYTKGGGLVSNVMQSFGSGLLTATTSAETTKKRREHVFGLAKVAVLLSESYHKLVAIDTASRGKVVWTMPLHPMAHWHKMIHGSSNSRSGVHGIHGGTASHEILVLSLVPPLVPNKNDPYDETEAQPARLEWKCIDGTTGTIHAHGKSPLSSTSDIIQLVPLFHHGHVGVGSGVGSGGGHGLCRQAVMILHADNRMTVVPNDEITSQIALDTVSSGSRNGMYVHAVDGVTSSLNAMKVTPSKQQQQQDSFGVANLVGQTTFAGEEIVSVTYPQSDEVIQSPSTILGDDSLLLKYLNPHLCVIITLGTTTAKDQEEDDIWYSALVDSKQKGTGSTSGEKRKPLGATNPGDATTSPSKTEEKKTASTTKVVPTLFVNVMDTVTGQILYRTSHAHATPSSSSSSVPTGSPCVLISENWIMYTFHNARHRRTELGVLTMFEGMIDKHGITAFRTPEQEVSFSSMASPKPIVLSKSYALPKPITALGTTKTRSGISTKHILVATADDKIMALDRRMIDPRRPTGEVKEHEKTEGLMRYSPLIPLVSLWTASHTETVHGVTHIVSTSAAVESQSLILAHGGPDIFFTRLAPSREFDMLPESFNRGALSVVVLGLIVVVRVVKNMGANNQVKLGWS